MNKKVLVVEDNISLQKILASRISAAGADVLTAATADEAFTHLKAQVPHLILLDIMLPGGKNGFDILEEVKRNPDWKQIPVIVLTNLEGEQKTAMNIGAVDYI